MMVDLNGAGGATSGGDVEGFCDRVSVIERVERLSWR